MDLELAKDDPKLLGRLSVNDALEALSGSGSSAWTSWCCATLAMVMCATAMQVARW